MALARRGSGRRARLDAATDDPYASVGMVGVLAVAAVLFTAFAAWVWRPLAGPAVGTID